MDLYFLTMEKFSQSFTMDDVTPSVQNTTKHQPTPDKEKSNDIFDPFSHRQVASPNSSFGSLINLMASCLGTGILTMPTAFRSSGYVIGIFGTIMVGSLITYCINMFVQVNRKMCIRARIVSLDYSDTVERTFELGPKPMRRFGKTARYFCDILLGATYFCICCASIVLIASSLQHGLHHIIRLPYHLYVVFVLLALIGFVQFRELKFLVPFSVVANLLMVSIIAICLFYILEDPLSFDGRNAVGPIIHFPFFMSVSVFALSAIGAALPVESQMREPHKFLSCPGVLVVAMTILIAVYTVFGFLGYLRYGDALSGSISLCLPNDRKLANAVQYLLVFAIFCIFLIQFYVFFSTIWRYVCPYLHEKSHNIYQIGLRTISVLLMGCVATAVPNLGFIIGLVGSVGFSSLGLGIPAVVEALFYWPQTGRYHLHLLKNAAIGMMAIFILITGVCEVFSH